MAKWIGLDLPGMRFVVPVVGSLANPAAVYARNGFTPKLVVDAITDTYISKSKVKTFAQMFDGAERDGLATMWGSDGTLKWCPHNTLIRSDVAYEGWNLSTADSYETGIIGPDGKPNAIRITDTDANGRVFLNNTVGYTGAVRGIWARSPEGNVSIRFFDTNSLNTFDITSEWAYYESDEGSFAGQNFYIADFRVGTATVVEVAYPREYMGGLGGMAPVPEDERVWDGDPYYLPTDGAARYLMRRGAYAYENGTWVPKGVLREDEEATNIVTEWVWSDTGSSVGCTRTTGQSNPLTGADDAALITADNTAAIEHRWSIAGSFTAPAVADQDVCTTVFVKKGTADYAYMEVNGSAPALQARYTFDLVNGGIAQTYLAGSGGAFSQYLGDGIWALSIVDAVDGDTGTPSVMIGPHDGTSAEEWDADGTETIIYLAHQVTATSMPVMPIPTYGTEVSRAGDPYLAVPPALLPVSEGMPAALSICFKGAINYADLSLYTQGAIFEWGSSSGNQLRVRLNTNSEDYLQAYGRVNAGSVFYQDGSMKEFQEGLNREVSLSAVYAVGYVRLAQDGEYAIASGASPDIPDVETENVYLLKTVHGVLGQFLLWDEDIGEAGIIEASALEEAA